MTHLPDLDDIQSDTALKTCCATLYENQWTAWFLGDSFHPGGLALTAHLGELLQLGPQDRVLDIASGQGTTAIFLAETFGCQVVGVEYGRAAVKTANRAAQAAGLSRRVTFHQGDAERLPFADHDFDVVLCECAFCTFPNKPLAAAEMSRVLKTNGRMGLSDLTCQGALPPALETLIAWIACIADAQPLDTYCRTLETAGVSITQIEAHDQALAELVQTVRGKLLAAELLVKLGKIDFPTADLTEAKKLARMAHDAVRQGKLGYTLLIGQKRQ